MMEICRRLDQFDPPCDRPLAIAVGTFDGVHLGHQWIIRQVTEWADRRHGVPGVFTFTNHPRAVLTPEKAPRLITPPALKARILARLGIGILVSIEFTAAFAQTEPEFFLDEVLVRGLGVRALMVGFNFGFGRDRRGTAELLARLGARRGLEVTVIPPVRVEGAIVQSTKIRELLMGGDLGKARALLGRSYALLGTVMPGAGRGSSLGFRTANLVAPADL
ncbi:MAG: adenylyltransferase/cytidyltransferase family protein, partial [Candidatus Methylomirabilales bacterium]